MMRLRCLLPILLFLSAAASDAARRGEGAATLGTIRLSEVRSASDEALVRLVLGPLAAFPYPTLREGLEHRRPGEPVELWFYSEAHATDRAGVCRTQRLIVTLDPVSGSGAADPRLRPAAFDLDDYFIIANERKARADEDQETRALDAACRALDPREAATLADSAYQLMKAIELMEQVGREARAGRLSVPLDCDSGRFFQDPPADDAACLARLAGFGRAQVDLVQSCPPRREAVGGCIRILARDLWLEFDLTLGQSLARVVVSGVERNDHG